MEDDLDEVDRQDNWDELLEADIIVLILEEFEISEENILELLLAEVEYIQ